MQKRKQPTMSPRFAVEIICGRLATARAEKVNGMTKLVDRGVFIWPDVFCREGAIRIASLEGTVAVVAAVLDQPSGLETIAQK